MKKIFYILTLIAITMGITIACSKTEDPIFEETTDERLAKELAEYKELLTSQTDGWYLVINTKRGGGFKFWVSFDDDFRAKVLSDMDATYSNVGETSTKIQDTGYRIKALMSPSLIFDTYSYIHVLADPNPKVIDGDRAEGLESDFEFSFVNVEDNGTINLKGNFNGCTAILVPVANNVQEIKNGRLKQEHIDVVNYASTLNFSTISIEGKTIAVDLNSRKVGFSYYEDNEDFVNITTSAYITPTGGEHGQIVFFDPVTLLDKNYVSIDWSNDAYHLIAEDGSKVLIFDNNRPPYPLYLGYDKTFTELYTHVDELEGSNSQVFLDEVYNVANNRMITERAGRSIKDMKCNFEFNSLTNEPEMRLRVTYTNKAGSEYVTTWYYTYETGNANTITFTSRRQNGNNNEFNYERSLREVPDFFCELEYENYDESTKPGSWNDVIITKTIPKTFKINWVENNTPGLAGNLGAFISVDNEDLFMAGQVSN